MKFFPSIEPFAGSRRRMHPMADAMGDLISSYWAEDDPSDELYYPLEADEWVVTPRLNAATNRNFTFWQEYSGPINANGDAFGLTVCFPTTQ